MTPYEEVNKRYKAAWKSHREPLREALGKARTALLDADEQSEVYLLFANYLTARRAFDENEQRIALLLAEREALSAR